MSGSPIMIRAQCVRAPRKFAPTWGKSVLAEQVSNTPNRTNHWSTGKSTRENKVVWEGSLTIRPLVTYQYIGDGFLDSFLLIYISLWHKFEDWLRWGWPEPQYWPLSIIPVIPVQCCSWYSNECMLQCYSVTVLECYSVTVYDAQLSICWRMRGRQLGIPLTGLALGPRKYRRWLTSSHWPSSPNIQYLLIAHAIFKDIKLNK